MSARGPSHGRAMGQDSLLVGIESVGSSGKRHPPVLPIGRGEYQKCAQGQSPPWSSHHGHARAGIAKLDDANDAGTRFSGDCTLILTEGDSAKALAVAGLSVVGRNRYGVFPLRCLLQRCHTRIQDEPRSLGTPIHANSWSFSWGIWLRAGMRCGKIASAIAASELNRCCMRDPSRTLVRVLESDLILCEVYIGWATNSVSWWQHLCCTMPEDDVFVAPVLFWDQLVSCSGITSPRILHCSHEC